MASYLIYNGVRLHLTRTNSFAQEPLYSPDGSDYLGTRVTIDLDAVYNPAFGAGTGPSTDASIRAALMVPRGQLVYRIGDTDVIVSPAPGFPVDVVNGPTPRACTTRLVTERTWRVNYRIETVVNACPPLSNGLLSNRWQQTHATGVNNLTTIVTRGVSVFRTDSLVLVGRNADAFRANCLPLVPRSFQRQSIVVRCNEIGNVLTWECVDQERYVSLGATLNAQRYGVIDFNAVHSMASIPAGEGGIASESTIHSIQVRAIGDRTSSRAGLFTWATRLAIEKLNLPGPGEELKPDDQAILTNVLFSEHVEAPIVDLAISARRAPSARANGASGPITTRFLGIDASVLFDPTGLNPQKPGGVRGTYWGEVFAAALKSACSQPIMPTSVVQGSPSPPDFPLGNSLTLVDVSVGPALVESDTKYDERTVVGGAITEAKIDVTYERDESTLTSPVAGLGGEPPVALKLANAIAYRIVDWTLERAFSKPPVPTPYSNDLNERLVGTPTITMAAPELAPDGQTPMYRISGRSTYLRLDGKGPGDDGLYMGAVPWATLRYDENTNIIRAIDYKHGITDPEFTTA